MSKDKCIYLVSCTVCSKQNNIETGPPQKNQQRPFNYQDTRENFNHNGHILKYMTAVVIAYNPLWTDKQEKRQEKFEMHMLISFRLDNMNKQIKIINMNVL